MKTAIGISIVQMVLSSMFGTYLNSRKRLIDFKIALPVASGGLVGALFSGSVVTSIPSQALEYAFIAFLAFAFIRMVINTKEVRVKPSYASNHIVLFCIGLLLGLVSISLGVGGSVLLIPILVGFFGVEFKKAIPIGLFFVMIASLSGVVSMSLHGHIEYKSALQIASAAIVGVYCGIWLGSRVNTKWHRYLILSFYTVVISYFIYRAGANG